LEIATCTEADLVFAVCESDKLALARYREREITLAPNGVAPWQASESDYEKWKAAFDADVSRFALYVASAHPPNVVHFFDVFNHALGFLAPNEAISVAGGASAAIERMVDGQRYESLNRSRLRFLGNVDATDLAAIKRLAHAFVLPILEGSGSNLKTAEALYSRSWVVGTPLSFRGFEHYTALQTVIVANPGKEFCAAVKHAMTHTPPSLSEGSRSSLEEITWQNTLAPMIEAIISEGERQQ